MRMLPVHVINDVARRHGHYPDLLPGQHNHVNFDIKELHTFAEDLLEAAAAPEILHPASPLLPQQGGEQTVWFSDMHVDALAMQLAGQEHDDIHQLIWEGNPPEPWGDVWCKYKPEAKRLIYLVKSTGPAAVLPQVGDAKHCDRCNDTGIVDDGEINCFPDGTPYECGPVKCVKDCPKCKGAAPASLGEAKAVAQFCVVGKNWTLCKVDEEHLASFGDGYHFAYFAAPVAHATASRVEKRDIEKLIQDRRICVGMEYEGPITVRVYDDAESPVAEGEGQTLRAAIVDALGADYA